MKKVLFSALALSMALTACNNELEEINASQEVTQGVVGADLVAHGMNITFAGADTRATNGKWEANDKFGLAWYNVENAITATQNFKTWKDAEESTEDGDRNIYANHLFVNGCDGFTTYGDIYQGAYFVVFPYNKLGAAKAMELNVNPEQTEDLATERWNKSTWISAQDFIDAKEVDVDGKLTKKFVMAPAVNMLSLKMNAEDAIKNNEVLKGLTIKSAAVNTNEAYFAAKATVKPASVPYAQYDKNIFNEAKTTKTLNDYIANAFEAEAAKSLTTTVDVENFNLDATRTVRMFTLPATASETAKPSSITVVVGNKDYNLGTFTLKTTGVNKEEFNKLAQRMTEQGRNGLSFTKVMKTATGEWTYTENNLVLGIAEFAPATSGIKTAKQWNDVIKVIDAVTELKGKNAPKAYTLSLSNDIKFDATENITAPANKDVVVTIANNGKKLTLTADAEWPANIAGQSKEGKNYVAIEVAPGATLTVDVNADKVLDFITLKDAKTAAYGKILVNENGTIHLADNAGRVIINQYGGKITKGNGNMGIIAYNFKGDEKAYMINNLITQEKSDEQPNLACVNTIIVEDATFNLAMKGDDNVKDDPYTGDNGSTTGAPLDEQIKNVNFELVGNGTLSNGTVNNVTAINEGNKLINVVPTEVIVEKDAKLEAASATKTKTFAYDKLTVKDGGVFTANGVTVNAKDIVNTNGTVTGVNGGIVQKA